MSDKKRLLLVGWDSADWKLIHPLLDDGKLPGVAKLVEGGVSGNLTTLEPQLSPMLWTSIATGKMAYNHGVHGFTEVDPVSGRVVPVSAATRQCKTVWEMLGERGLKSHVVGWFATQGERDLNGCMVSNMFGHLKGVAEDQDPADWPATPPGTYWPEELRAKLEEFRVSPFEIDPNQILRLFVPDAPTIDQERDPRLWTLAERLAEAYSVHSAATWLMEMDPDWNFFAVYFRALDEIKHEFMHYHPPRMEGIPERDFELYKSVVTATYRAHDLMLQRLIGLAGEDTAVVLVSDHGFHSDHLRPKFTPRVPAGITVWHRPQGVIAAKGPGLKQDELLYGAGLLDVTPTILHYFGLPVGDDMEGRVLAETFAESRPIETVPSWEDSGGSRQPRGSLSEADSKALLDQFVSLGYIDEISDDPSEAAATTNRENKWSLARACLYAGKEEMALPLLEDCYDEHPERADFAQSLARCQLKLGLLEEAEATNQAVLESFGRTEIAHLFQANVAIEQEDYEKALRHLETVRGVMPDELELLIPLGTTYLALRRWDDLEVVANRALELDPNNVPARLGLARLKLHCGEADAAADEALEAIGLQYGNPRGHFLLGLALTQQKNWKDARVAFGNTIKLNPGHARAHRLLAWVLRFVGEHQEAVNHEVRSHVVRYQRKTQQANRATRVRAEAAGRARERRDARRQKREEAARLDVESAAVEPMDLVLVSGLPRSGTSLMMQMLGAGGMELMTDGERKADEDNPEGYWEWENIKKLRKNPLIIEQAEGKVVKVISALLPHLPPKHRYKIIFMRRPENEVVRSQWKMLEHRGANPKSEAEHLANTQTNHRRQIIQTLEASDRVELLEVDFPSLVADPAMWVPKIVCFLGADACSTPNKMLAAVRPELYRNRGDVSAEG